MTDYLALKEQNQLLNNQEIAERKLKLESRPLTFSLDLIGKCSLECKHCGCHWHGRSSRQEMEDDVYQKVVDEILPTAFKCHLGGGNYGEVTLSKKFARFVEDAQRMQVRINLTTNGTIVKDAWLDGLLSQLIVVGFSMEGLREQFEIVRGFKWTKFLKNIEKYVEGRERLGLDFRTEWRYCAHSDSISQLPEMIRLAKKMGIDRIQIMPLIPYVETQRYKQLLYHRTLANRYFEEAREVAAEEQIDVKIPPNYKTGTFEELPDAEPSLLEELKGHTVTLPNCLMPWQNPSIDELGNVKACHIYWRPLGNIGQGGAGNWRETLSNALGNLYGNSFAAVWNGPRYQYLRATVNGRCNSTCRACRMPMFDSEDNYSASALTPSIRRQLVRKASETLYSQSIQYDGIVDWAYDLYSER